MLWNVEKTVQLFSQGYHVTNKHWITTKVIGDNVYPIYKWANLDSQKAIVSYFPATFLQSWSSLITLFSSADFVE